MHKNSPTDFSKLKIQDKLSFSCGSGLTVDSFAYIEKWCVVAFGYKDCSKFSVGLYDLEAKRPLATLRELHRGRIISIVWIDHKNYLITGSDDSVIRVYRVYNKGIHLEPIHRFIGHKSGVRCLRYVPKQDLLISTGHDTNIKLWDINRLRRRVTINTYSADDMEGTIAYIEADDLIGVVFNSQFIRFYDLRKRNVVLELQTVYSKFIQYGHYGFQYLSQRKLIIANVSEDEIRVWKYTEGKREAQALKPIIPRGLPFCLIANEDESQLLYSYIGEQEQCLELYDFDKEETSLVAPPKDIIDCTGLTFLGSKGVILGDWTSGNMYILNLPKSCI